MLSRIIRSVTAILAFTAGGVCQAQDITVRGKVTDAATGEPMAGVTVMVKGSSIGDLTLSDGSYTIKAGADDILFCSMLGYKEVETPVGGRGRIDFSLEEDSRLLEEAVVVGYGTLKRAQLVGSVENLSGDAIQDRPNSNVTRSLQGQIAGLNIIQTDGKASHSGNVYIRGNGTTYYTRKSTTSASGQKHSIGSEGSALVLIDGVEGSLSQVNPADVETVAVLKDASSAAIYGARAAYGVILVTTKTAEREKFTVTYNGSYSLNSRLIMWEDNVVTDGLEYMEAFYEFYGNDTRVPGSSGKVPTTVNTASISMSSGDYLDVLRSMREAGDDTTIGGLGSNGQYLYWGNTNWLKMFYKRYNSSTTHDVSVRGSSKKLTYSLTGRYFTQEGIYKIGEDTYNTYNIRAKAKLQVNDWLSFDNNTSLFRSDQVQPMFSNTSVLGKQLEQHGQPIFVPYNEDGTYTLNANKTGFTSFIEGNTGQTDQNVTVVSATGVTLTPKPEVLTIRGDFSYKAIRRQRERYRAPMSFYSAPGNATEYVTQASSYKSRWTYDTDYIVANAYATWTPKFGPRHELNVVGGWNLEDYQYNRFYLQRKGMLFADMHDSYELFDGTDINIEQDDSSYGIVGFFARANYTLLRRYIIELAGRYDGSSKFPTDQRWGFFPSASAGWRLSEEPFMKWSKAWLDNLKLRANYGSLGNGTISPYSFLETMSINRTSIVVDGKKVNYTSQPTPVPESLTWETVTTYDFGMDLDMLGNRLSFSGDAYRRNTTDLITTGPELPDLYGDDAPKGNYASLKTIGWELTLSWRDAFRLWGDDLSYGIKASLWDSRTWVDKFTTTTVEGTSIYDYYSGKELGEIWGFRTDGYFLSNEEADNWATDTFHKNGSNFRAYAGDLKFIDVNGDGTIDTGAGTVGDHGDMERIGNTTPRYQFGLNVDLKWKGLGLSLFFQGVGKRDWYPAVESGYFWGQYNRPYGYLMKSQTGDNYVQIDYSTDNWVVTNADAKPYWTRRVGYAANRNVGPLTMENDYYLQNAAYVRLKNLTVDYSFPAKVASRAGLSAARVYVSMENLWTWSPIFRHTDMFDPEVIATGDSDFDSDSKYGLSGVGDGYSYPMLRTFTFGISLTF